MSSEFICVAIDGTNSGTPVYKDSNVRKFFNSLKIDSQYKYFSDGPGEHSDPNKNGGKLDMITGGSCAKIADEAWSWLSKKIATTPNAKVILVGHSRGGHIVTNLAMRLSTQPRESNQRSNGNALIMNSPQLTGSFLMQQKLPSNTLNLQTASLKGSAVCSPDSGTYFLGLYDAVKMTSDELGDTSIVPASVEYLCHIKRSSRLGSRHGWENTADKTARKDQEKYVTLELEGTHGSIGGSDTEGCEGGRIEILLTARLAGRVAGRFTGGFVGEFVGASAAYKAADITISNCNYKISAETDQMAGKAAHAAMIVHARKARIPIKTA